MIIRLILIWLCASSCFAETELEVCRRLAPKYKAKTEVILWDDSRVDLLTETEVIEVDWAGPKVYEAIGQAQWYSIATNLKPAVLILKRSNKIDEIKAIYRCQAICAKLGMKMYVEEVLDEK